MDIHFKKYHGLGNDYLVIDPNVRDVAMTEANIRLICDRNVHMVEKIEQMLKQPGKYFVMVGSAHFVGEKGIVKTLEGKGYTVTQIEKAGVPEAVEAPAAAQ